MSSNSSATATASSGVSVFTLAFIVLLVFKLADVAGASWGLDISWWLVFSPLLISFGIVVLFLIFLFVMLVIFDR